MEKETIYLGSHVGMNGPDYYLGSVKEALSYHANTFMFYTGAPQNTYRKPLEELKIEEGRALIKEAGIDESKIIVHAPYIINPANFGREDLIELSINVLTSELIRTHAFHVNTIVLHPGASVGQDRTEAMKSCAHVIDIALENAGNDVKIAVETMAGKGSEIGITFQEVRFILDEIQNKDKVGVCLDTCHIHDAGYDVNDIDHILEEFDKYIGLDKLLVVHINDSKNVIGAHKDRHENIGYGQIGFKALAAFIHHPKLKDVPKILETPYYNEKPPYKEEIQMLLNNEFIEGWRK